MKPKTDEPHDPPEPQEPPAPLPVPRPPAGLIIVGTNSSDALQGTSGADVIHGLDGNDIVYGLAGDDRLYGDAGNDWLDGGAGADVLDGGAGEDWVSYINSLWPSGVAVDLGLGGGSRGEAQGDTYFGIEHVQGSRYNDQLFGNAANNVLVGDGGGDMLYGRAGNDTLLGGEGHDNLDGGAGSDALDGGAGEDWVLYAASSTGVTVNLLTGSGAGGDAQGDIYFDIENVDGSTFADVLIGNAGDNKLWGKGGDDQLLGGAGNDQLLGGEGNDALRGGAGADFMDGGAGTDTLSYQDSSAGVLVNLASLVKGWGGDAEGDTYYGIENIVGSSHMDSLYGDDGSNDLVGLGSHDRLHGYGGNDRLLGGEGDDRLSGGAGADVLDGGDGNDWIEYLGSLSGVTINLATSIGSGGDAQGDTYFGIENVSGTLFDDVITGDAGDNVLDGYGGADRLDGGDGIDTVIYETSAGVVVNLATGIGSGGNAQGDTYFNIENVIGSSSHDVIIGNAGNNDIQGNDGDDALHGGAGNDRLFGGFGNDVLDGGAGADSVNGGHGSDWIDYSGSLSGVTVNLVTGTGSGGDAQGDTLFDIENVSGSAFADVLVGTAGDNLLWGNDGNDQLFGGAGNDQLLGSDGNDALRGGAGADHLSGGAGTDTVYYQDSSAGVSVDLGPNQTSHFGDAEGDICVGIENAVGSSHGDSLAGNADSNDLIGLGGNDTLHGYEGNDRLLGGEGDDRLAGGAGADKLDGGNGIDWVRYYDSGSGVTVNLATGSASGGTAAGDTFLGIENVSGSDFDDVLIGDAGNNHLYGGDGNDTLIGGAGQDTLRATGGHDIFTGDGSGAFAADTFVFGVSWGNYGHATITDFQHGVDKIDLVRVHHFGSDSHATLQDFGTDGELAWGFTDQNGLHANALDATDKYFFDTASHTLYACDFTSGTLVLGNAIVTIDAEAPRLQTSDFVLG
jgi:Ca2+-binding RTX toxin-like protein